MRFGFVHRVTTDALAALGLASLLTSGQLDRWVVVSLLIAFGLAVLIPERWQTHRRVRSLGVMGSMGLLIGNSLRLFAGHDPLSVAVEFAAGLQVVRVATRRGAAHDQQIILLALLHLVAGTVLGSGLAYGLCFIGFLVVAPGALVLSHLRREVEGNYRQGARDRTGLPVDVPRILRSRRVISSRFLVATCSLSVPIFIFTALLFILFPRVGLSLLLMNHNRSERMVGFSDRVDLGKVGRLRADPTIALRVHIPHLGDEPPPRIPLYLRGTAFDTYDGSSWSRDPRRQPANRAGSRVWVERIDREFGPELMTIDLEPFKPPVMFLPGNVAGFEIVSNGDRALGNVTQISRGPEDDFEYVSLEERGIRYRVFASRNSGPRRLLMRDARRYLTLPAELPLRVKELAASWANPGASPLEMAKRIERELRENYTYDLDSPSGKEANPLDHFLFESRRGHCEYYSTSMAIMLRTLGIPSRNVTGFIGGTLNRFGHFYAVRQGDAHSWVEAFIDGRGWTRFDPTPVAESAPRAEISGVVAFLRDMIEAAGERWDRNVVGYDLKQQVGLLRGVGRSWRAMKGRASWNGFPGRTVAAVVALLLVLSGVMYWRMRRGRGQAGDSGGLRGRKDTTAQVVLLYLKLEEAMRARGIGRKAETPPLAHARGLLALAHPLAPEILELTEIYLDVRFGRATLTPVEVDSYKQRVSELRRAAIERAA